MASEFKNGLDALHARLTAVTPLFEADLEALQARMATDPDGIWRWTYCIVLVLYYKVLIAKMGLMPVCMGTQDEGTEPDTDELVQTDPIAKAALSGDRSRSNYHLIDRSAVIGTPQIIFDIDSRKMTPLRLVLEIYDRLIHPKSDADRDISDGEVETMLKAYGLLREFTTWMVHAYAPAPTGRLDISAWLQGIGFPTNPAEGQCGMRPGEWQDG